MKHWIVAVAASVVLLAGGWSIGVADDGEPAKPAVAQPAETLPVDGASTVGGCMPGGGCCGACSEKSAAPEKPADAQAEGGGCPCMRNKQKPAS